MDFHHAKMLLEWQIDLGATEAICDAPVNRFDLDAKPATSVPLAAEEKHTEAPETPMVADVDPVAEATELAAQAQDLEALRAVMTDYPHCDLRHGARNFVFSDGVAGAALMVIGEAPGRDEDLDGKPFVGRAGQLLDRMLIAIGRQRADADPDQGVYITNILPWRPPQNRDPAPEEMAMMLPFVQRHVELANPKVLLLMGNIPCQALLGRRGITKLRGQWADALGRRVMPSFHPSYLLRCASRGDANPKRQAWSDMLAVQAALNQKTL